MRPFVRWWWLNGPFTEAAIEAQLRWVADNGFGGVELAWLHPSWALIRADDHPRWLDEKWLHLVAFAGRTAAALGLGCDFTFGSVWPFGGTCVTEQHASKTFDGISGQRVRSSWEEPARGRVLDHLSAAALDSYFDALVPSFAPLLRNGRAALFCDSLEVDKQGLWSPALWDAFEERCGYSLRDHVEELPDNVGVLYDYKKVLGEAWLREFFEHYTRHCRALGAVSRVQCHGAPTDLLSAYAAADVPESEVLLFPPAFSRIPASAAALAGRAVVSCETFTCIHGFPRGRFMRQAIEAWKSERVEDLRLLADAAFANGVNQVIWHGMPYRSPGGEQEFYASVHVGPDAAFAAELPAFNAYMAQVSAALRRGRPISRLAVYLPNEDMMIAGDLPDQLRSPGAVDFWEMRTVSVPEATEGFAPLWISGPFLKDATFIDGELAVGELRLPALLVDVEWLDAGSLRSILRLARAGLPVALLRDPQPPGRFPDSDFGALLGELRALPGVVRALDELSVSALVEGESLPWFWAREDGDEIVIFFAHPAARDIRYGMVPGFATAAAAESRSVRIRGGAFVHDVDLEFPPGESLLVIASPAGVRYEPLPLG